MRDSRDDSQAQVDAEHPRGGPLLDAFETTFAGAVDGADEEDPVEGFFLLEADLLYER